MVHDISSIGKEFVCADDDLFRFCEVSLHLGWSAVLMTYSGKLRSVLVRYCMEILGYTVYLKDCTN